MYGAGVERNVYYETTIYGKDEETAAARSVVAYEQREPWGSLPGKDGVVASTFTTCRRRGSSSKGNSHCASHGACLSRQTSVPRESAINWRPARGATDEEILLRIRRLQTGYEQRVGVSVTYTFGVDLQLGRQSTIRAVGAGDAEREPADLVKWLVPLAAACLILLLPVPDGLTRPRGGTAVFVFVVVGPITEPVAAPVIGFIGLCTAAVLRLVAPTPTASVRWALSGFSNDVVWLVFSATTFALGYEITGLGRRIVLLLGRSSAPTPLTGVTPSLRRIWFSRRSCRRTQRGVPGRSIRS